MNYVNAMEKGWDDVQFRVEAYDWKNSSFDDAQQAALRVVDAYDFKKKQVLHRNTILYVCKNVREIERFVRNIAWSGAKIKYAAGL
tara:strand:- start:313 stop:570 length:258 start_codon:yes stop_codon:yes gene_type:complete